jgi:type VI secretion system ImpA family protein
MIDKGKMAALLRPLKGGDQAGTDVRYGPAYDNINRLRRTMAEAFLPEGVWTTTTDVQQLRPQIEALCIEILTTQSKDLQVAFWLVEAWCHKSGLLGLEEGLRIVQKLEQTFGAHLYPHVTDADSAEHMLNLIEWWAETLVSGLFETTLIAPQQPGVASFTWGQYLATLKHHKLSKKQKDPSKYLAREGVGTLEELQASSKETYVSFYDALQQQAKRTKDVVRGLEQLFERRLVRYEIAASGVLRGAEKALENLAQQAAKLVAVGKPDPLAQKLKKKLRLLGREDRFDSSQDVVQALPSQAPSSEESATLEASTKETAPQAERPAQDVPTEMTRKLAYQKLEEVADFLMTNEPQSPVPHLLKKIRTWESKNYTQLLEDMGSDAATLQVLGRLLGAQKSTSNSST